MQYSFVFLRPLLRLGVAHAFGKADVGHGKAVAHEPFVLGEMCVNAGEGAVQVIRREGDLGSAVFGLGFIFRIGIEAVERLGFDARRAHKGPLGDLPVFGSVLRAKIAAMNLGQIERGGHGFGQHKITIGDAGHLALGVDGEKIGRGGVERRIRAERIGQAIPLDHRDQVKRRVGFHENPDWTRGT